MRRLLLIAALAAGCASVQRKPDEPHKTDWDSVARVEARPDEGSGGGWPDVIEPLRLQIFGQSEAPAGFLGPTRVNGNLLPGADNTYALGSTGARWQNIFLGNALKDAAGNERLGVPGTLRNAYTCAAANSGTNVCHIFTSVNTLSGSTRIAEFHNDSAAAAAEAYIGNDGRYVASSGTGVIQANVLEGQSTSATLQLGSQVADGAGRTAAQIYAFNTLSTADTNVVRFENPQNTVQSRINKDGFYIETVQTDATGGAWTLTPTSGYVQLNPGSAATITMGETGVQDGTRVCITNIHATNAAGFSDTSGVSELAGAFSMGQYDVLCLIYVSDRWVETSRSNN